LSRDDFEHYKNLADAQAPKVALLFNEILLFMEGLRYLLWFEFCLEKGIVTNSLSNSFW
jgi:hypothetical protein